MTNDEAKSTATMLLATNSRFSGAEIEALETIQHDGLTENVPIERHYGYSAEENVKQSINQAALKRTSRLRTIAVNHGMVI